MGSWFLGFWVGIGIGLIASSYMEEAKDRKWERECVVRGVAEYVATEDGKAEWRWKEEKDE